MGAFCRAMHLVVLWVLSRRQSARPAVCPPVCLPACLPYSAIGPGSAHHQALVTLQAEGARSAQGLACSRQGYHCINCHVMQHNQLAPSSLSPAGPAPPSHLGEGNAHGGKGGRHLCV